MMKGGTVERLCRLSLRKNGKRKRGLHRNVQVSRGTADGWRGEYGDRTRETAQGAAEKAEKAAKSVKSAPAPEKKKKLSYKEQKEFEQIEKDLERLSEEKARLESDLSSGTLPFDQLQKISERIGQIIEETDEKEMRWLELSENL